MQKPIKGMKYAPYGKDNMIPAWVAFFQFSIFEEKIRKEFEEDRKIKILEVITAKGINALIDKATGYQHHAIVEFADWITLNYWGVE